MEDLVRTVDISGWFAADAIEDGALHGDALRDEVAANVDREGRRIGFLRITGHRVPDDLVQRMLAVTTAFFDLPEAEKMRYLVEDKSKNRGYAAYGTEALAYSLGVDSKPDMFEAYNCGVEVADDTDAYIAAERHRLFAENVWPTSPSDMRAVWTQYFAAMDALAMELMRIFARALNMPEDYLVERTSRAPSVMRANNYERRSHHREPEPGQVRMGAHTDYGTCTILLADPVPGLQIVGPDGAWHDVLPEPGTLLVNIGDLLAEWTNDRWRSTLHRVVPPPSGTSGPSRRRSIAFFHEANYDAVVTVMESCVTEDQPAKYPPVTAGEHLMNKLMGPRTLTPSTANQTVDVTQISTTLTT
jgi:isopenicillin N synthase-like dioxygenase